MRLSVAVLSLVVAVGLGGCVASDAGDTVTPAAEPGGAPAAASASLAGNRFIATDGAALPLRAWLPDAPPAAVILALHGLNDYSNAFALPAPALTAQGIAVYAYDQRGFGAAPLAGHWPGDDVMVRDAAIAAALLRQLYPTTPLYLLGESMGGAVAILAASGRQAAPVDGVILSAPAVWGRQTMNVFERVGVWFARRLPAMEFSQRSIPYPVQASDNIPMLRALGADPLVLKTARSDTLAGVVDLMSAAFARAPRLAVPALVLYGEKDEIVPRDAVAAFVDSLPPAARSRQHIALYPHGYHMLLRDLQGATVLADIIAWLRDPRSGLPSGADNGARAALTRHDSIALN